MARSVGTPTRIVLIAAVIALVAAGSGALGLVLSNDDDELADDQSDASESTTTTERINLDELRGSARDLAELLAEGRSTTYHARYAGSATGENEGTIAIESWAKDGQFRQDVAFEVGDIAVQRSTFVLDDRGVSCQRSGDEPWACSDLPKSEVQGADPLTGSALAQLRGAAVGEAAGEVEGRPARCFTVSFDAQSTEMCVSAEGVPLQIRTASSRLVIELLEHDVDDAVFEPPA